jgi:hypothetical protein
MSDAANEKMAVETADDVVAPAGRASLRQGYGRLISPAEELITLTGATAAPAQGGRQEGLRLDTVAAVSHAMLTPICSGATLISVEQLELGLTKRSRRRKTTTFPNGQANTLADSRLGVRR